MDELADPLTRSGNPDRLFYALGTMLGAEDFADEQAYHRGRLARALRYLHGSGTVAGLAVSYAPAVAPGADPKEPLGHPEEVRVLPGMAIDRVGRVVEVPRRACIRLPQWYAGPTDTDTAVDKEKQARHTAALVNAFNGTAVLVDVFLRFAECERGKTPAFAAGPFDALDAVVPSRVRDWYALDLVPAVDRAKPFLPADPWAALAPGASLRTRLDTVYSAWFDELATLQTQSADAVWSDEAAALGTATSTAVFLARLELPATAGAAGKPPTRTTGVDVAVRDENRPIVYPSAALARLAGF